MSGHVSSFTLLGGGQLTPTFKESKEKDSYWLLLTEFLNYEEETINVIHFKKTDCVPLFHIFILFICVYM